MKTRLAWISLLALVLAAPAFAGNWGDVRDERYRDVRYRGSIPAPPRVIFRRQPRMVAVPGLSVFLVATFERPGYDMFLCDDRYYIYNDDTWYWSPRFDGPFQYCDEREVPRQIFRVPSDSWRSYPRRWASAPPRQYGGGGWGDTRRWNGGSDRGGYSGGSRGDGRGGYGGGARGDGRGGYGGGARGDGRGGYGDQGGSRGSGRGDQGDWRGKGRGEDGDHGDSHGQGRGQGHGQGRGQGRGHGRGNGGGNGHGND